MISMQTSVISLMILPSPWLCGGSVVNMSSGARESGKCVKTQLQLVCSNYGSGEFVTTSLLIKRDFLMWINVIYKGKFQSSRRHLLPQHAHSERGRRTPGLPLPAWPTQGAERRGCVGLSFLLFFDQLLAKSGHCKRSLLLFPREAN